MLRSLFLLDRWISFVNVFCILPLIMIGLTPQLRHSENGFRKNKQVLSGGLRQDV